MKLQSWDTDVLDCLLCKEQFSLSLFSYSNVNEMGVTLVMGEKKRACCSSYLHFYSYSVFVLLSESKHACLFLWGGDCWCDRLGRGWCLELPACYLSRLSVFVPSGSVNWMSLTSGIEAWVRESGEESRMTTASLAGGVEFTLPLTPSAVLSISDIQKRLSTCMHKDTKAGYHTATQLPLKTHPHTRTLTLFWLRTAFMSS